MTDVAKGRSDTDLSVACETARRSESRQRTATIGVRVTESQKREIQHLAAVRGLSTSALLLAGFELVASLSWESTYCENRACCSERGHEGMCDERAAL